MSYKNVSMNLVEVDYAHKKTKSSNAACVGNFSSESMEPNSFKTWGITAGQCIA